MSALFEFLLRQGDNVLVLGHRTSEWCGTAPALEEDIALANTALDLIGQTQLWLGYAAEVEGKELDFGRTIMRQYLFDAFQVPWLTALANSNDKRIADIAIKSVKEAKYHLERSSSIVIALGDDREGRHCTFAKLDIGWLDANNARCLGASKLAYSGRGLLPQGRTQWPSPYGALGPYAGYHAGASTILSRCYMVTLAKPSVEEIWSWLENVPDPEIPVISVVDLGVIRDVRWINEFSL
ncbi:1,2-phenylacetyl-CoA epoxidase, subunit C [Nymphon striatum]|nr:1,2-phenylacetyl-CoA epoxidase, subunit C [Nymphon striatum]